jgi:hypothetical protein
MKNLLLDGTESVGEIADRMQVDRADVIRMGFGQLGRMWTVLETPERSDAVLLAEHFGFRVRWITPPGI